MFDPWLGKIPWRRERLLTPVFWPGEFYGLHSPGGRKESDRTKRLSLQLSHIIRFKFPNHKMAQGLNMEIMRKKWKKCCIEVGHLK